MKITLEQDELNNPEGEYYFGLHCGVEDRDITDRYEATDYGWDQAFEYIYSVIDGRGDLWIPIDEWEPVECECWIVYKGVVVKSKYMDVWAGECCFVVQSSDIWGHKKGNIYLEKFVTHVMPILKPLPPEIEE